MSRIALFFLLLCAPLVAGAAQTPTPDCTASQPSGSERCQRFAMDSAAVALDRTVGRVLELLPDSLRSGFLVLSAKWEEYRRLECQRLHASFEGGTLAGLAYATCFARLSQERAAFLADAYNFALMDPDARGGCLGYGPDTVSLTGTLSRQTHPGPPDYERVAAGDEPETGFYLTVAAPICVSRNIDEVNEPTVGVRVVQLVLDNAGYDRLRPSLGGAVTVRGVLYHSYSGHHHAELLLTMRQ